MRSSDWPANFAALQLGGFALKNVRIFSYACLNDLHAGGIMKIFTIVLMVGAIAWYTWMVDVQGGRVLLRQHASESFPHVEGVVSSSEITTTRGSKGHIFYHPYITYRYSVDGLAYRGYRYRYDGHPNDEDSVNAIVEAHPRGSAIEVYYNPQDPNNAVLSPMVDAGDVDHLFMFTPVILVFLWAFARAMKRLDSGESPAAGGVKIITEMMVTRARLPRYLPVSFGLLTAGILSLTAGILMATGVLGPPWEAGEWSLLVVLLGGAAVYAWQCQKVHSGRQDLVIDDGARIFQLPLTYKRRERTPMPISQVRSVLLNKVSHSSKGGSYYTYLVTLEMKDNSQEKLVDLSHKRAWAFAAWLKEKLGLVGPTLEIEPET